ncbi:MAG: hypothetical protein JW795_21835 [Chitinivibrionales bacterium]|nr:hypothetical protein [Chitinivibrionales bacterium]
MLANCLKLLFLIAVFAISCTEEAGSNGITQVTEIKGAIVGADNAALSNVKIEIVEINNAAVNQYKIFYTNDNGWYECIHTSNIAKVLGADVVIGCTYQIKIRYSKSNYKTVEKEFLIDREEVMRFYFSNNTSAKIPGLFKHDFAMSPE